MDDDQDDQCPEGGVGASPLHIAQSPDKPVDGSKVCTMLSNFTIIIIINNNNSMHHRNYHRYYHQHHHHYDDQVRAELRGCTYLEDSSVTIRGVKIYGKETLS